MERPADIVHRMALDAAAAGIIWLTVLAGVEALLRGFVSRFFDMDLLVLWILVATLVAFFSRSAHRTEEDASLWGAALFLIGLAAAVVTAFKTTAGLPPFWRFAASAAVLAVAFLSRHLLKND